MVTVDFRSVIILKFRNIQGINLIKCIVTFIYYRIIVHCSRCINSFHGNCNSSIYGVVVFQFMVEVGIFGGINARHL